MYTKGPEVFKAFTNSGVEQTVLQQADKICAETGDFVRKQDYDTLRIETTELLDALRTMLVATNSNAPLPEGHPGHEAYLNIVAKPRAEQAVSKAERGE